MLQPPPAPHPCPLLLFILLSFPMLASAQLRKDPFRKQGQKRPPRHLLGQTLNHSTPADERVPPIKIGQENSPLFQSAASPTSPFVVALWVESGLHSAASLQRFGNSHKASSSMQTGVLHDLFQTLVSESGASPASSQNQIRRISDTPV